MLVCEEINFELPPKIIVLNPKDGDIILHNKTGQSFTGIFFQKEMYRKEKTLGKAAYL